MYYCTSHAFGETQQYFAMTITSLQLYHGCAKKGTAGETHTLAQQ